MQWVVVTPSRKFSKTPLRLSRATVEAKAKRQRGGKNEELDGRKTMQFERSIVPDHAASIMHHFALVLTALAQLGATHVRFPTLEFKLVPFG